MGKCRIFEVAASESRKDANLAQPLGSAVLECRSNGIRREAIKGQGGLMATIAEAPLSRRSMTGEEIKVITASSAGTIFEWYDFYLYGSLAAMIGAKFFSAFDVNTRA